MTTKSFVLALAAAQSVLAYPWVPQQPGVDSSLLPTRRAARNNKRATTTCAFNPDHVPAAPITSEYPYLGSVNGSEGSTAGGIQVPAPGDTAHQFIAPDYTTDIRGPCPGLNVLANYNFIARDGITTFNELVSAQQNVYNTGYQLAELLAIAGVGLTGDIVGTERMSIGCDATSRTAGATSLLADETGLDGHNKFEADTSLTRDDYFLGDGDDYTFNATLFTQMMSYCADGSGGYNCSREQLGEYRGQRWEDSMTNNEHFFFGPGSLLLYGAASFLYELMPGSSGSPDEATMMSFFGVEKDSDGTYVGTGEEKLPANWTNRLTSYSNDVTQEIVEMYLVAPRPFGGNVGAGNFLGLNFGDYIVNGTISPDIPYNILCLAYEFVGATPAEFGDVLDIPVALENLIIGDITPMAENLGCPLNPNAGDQTSKKEKRTYSFTK